MCTMIYRVYTSYIEPKCIVYRILYNTLNSILITVITHIILKYKGMIYISLYCQKITNVDFNDICTN